MCRRAWPAGILVLVAAAGAAASGVWRHSRQWTPRAALHLSTRADGGLPPPPPTPPPILRAPGRVEGGGTRACREMLFHDGGTGWHHPPPCPAALAGALPRRQGAAAAAARRAAAASARRAAVAVAGALLRPLSALGHTPRLSPPLPSALYVCCRRPLVFPPADGIWLAPLAPTATAAAASRRAARVGRRGGLRKRAPAGSPRRVGPPRSTRPPPWSRSWGCAGGRGVREEGTGGSSDLGRSPPPNTGA